MTLRDHVLEVLHTLRPLGPIKARYCMGQSATLIYHERVIGIVSLDGLFIKVDELTEPEFSKWKSPRFVRRPRMPLHVDFPFRRLPEGAQHCSKAMIAWARLGIEAVNREIAAGS